MYATYRSSTRKGGAGNDACKVTSMLGLAARINGINDKHRRQAGSRLRHLIDPILESAAALFLQAEAESICPKVS